MAGALRERIEALNDLELTILSCLVVGEHCVVSAPLGYERQLRDDIYTACSSTFDLDPSMLTCTSDTSVDELNNSLISQPGNDEGQSIAKVMVLYDLDTTKEEVQIQVIELLRTRRVYTKGAMHVAPRDFLLIITLSRPSGMLSYHLNDMIAASHLYEADDKIITGDGSLLSAEEVDQLRAQARSVRLTAEIDAYLYDVVLFMRMSRYIQAGVSATATRQLRVFSKALAALHGIDFITPSIVLLATRKVYPHRLIKATGTTEKSLQWGSDPSAVERLLDELTIPQVIEDVLASVETPL